MISEKIKRQMYQFIAIIALFIFIISIIRNIFFICKELSFDAYSLKKLIMHVSSIVVCIYILINPALFKLSAIITLLYSMIMVWNDPTT